VPTVSPTATPTPTVTPPKPRTVAVKVSSSFVVPAGASPKVACGANVGLELRKGKTVLARRTVALRRRGRVCRFNTTFTLPRAKVGTARTLRCVVRYRGTRALGARSWPLTVRVG
jgi:hypothetical protein